MKYLKSYNESIDKVATCIQLTGYTYQELVDIFTLNLEDNTQFEITDIKGHLLPTDDPTSKRVFIELVEDFNENQEFRDLLFNAKITDREYHIGIINKKLLDVIGKKYDMIIGKVELRGMLGNNKYRVGFNIGKNNTTA